MAIYIKPLSSAIALCAITIPFTASADVQWEHTITARVSTLKDPLLKASVISSFTPQRYRFDLRFDMQGVAQSGLGHIAMRPTSDANCLPALPKHPDKFDISSIHRYDDDTVIAYSSMKKEYRTDSFDTVLQKLRFDPWKKLAPRLSKEQPPKLTPAHRARLGAEVRSTLRPFLKPVLRTYFRPLPNQRTFDGITGRGYRMTWLMNAGGMKPAQAQWMEIAFEWWLAPQLPGDEDVRGIRKMYVDKMNALPYAWPTASMWLNESLPVLWQCMPQELLQAWETVRPADGSFSGMPLRCYITIKPPSMVRAAAGDLRIEMALTKRSTEALPAALFDAPAGYEKKPFVAPWDELEKAMKQHLPPAIKSHTADAGLTWQAWRECTRQAQSALPALRLF